ncbi:MAG: transglutaminase-like domain-containing protein [Candidatus Hadarchaeales archaeon]
MRYGTVVVFLILLLPTVEATGYYYNFIIQDYWIQPDRSVRLSLDVKITNEGPPISGLIWKIPGRVERIQAWDREGGELRVSPVQRDNYTEVEISFTSPIPTRGHGGFRLDCTVEGAVEGTGPEFRGGFGGFATERRVESYVVRVWGPPGTRLFLASSPARAFENFAELGRTLSAGESFEGIYTIFYRTPLSYEVSLSETLSNPGERDSTVLLDVLLFHRSEYQFATLCTSSHPLKSLYLDEENNWHANIEVRLRPGESEEIQLQLLYITEMYVCPTPQAAGRLEEIDESLARYLQPDTWWEVNNPSIQELATQLVGRESDVYTIAYRLLQGVGGLITYRETELRQGALKTLAQRTGDCDGYSDLTIALARASGLPARLCTGWVPRENGGFGAHAWVEIYTPAFGWQSVDPTWTKEGREYIFKSEPTRLQRAVRGLSSSDSSISIEYFGPSPTISEAVEISAVEDSDILPMLLQACRLSLEMAGRLVGQENPVLAEARNHYNLAENFSSAEHARRSLEYSSQILANLGRKAQLERELPLPSWVIILILAVGGVLTVGTLLRRR